MEKIEVSELSNVNVTDVDSTLGYSAKLGKIVRFGMASGFSSIEVLVGNEIYLRDRTGQIDIGKDIEVRLLRKKKVTGSRGKEKAISSPDKPFKKRHCFWRNAGWKWTDYLNNSTERNFIKLEKVSEVGTENDCYLLNFIDKLDFVRRSAHSDDFRLFWHAKTYKGIHFSFRMCSPRHHSIYQHLALRLFNKKTGEFSDLIRFRHIISTTSMAIIWDENERVLDEDGNTLYDYRYASLTETFALV